MSQRRKLPSREHVFIGSLLQQGFRIATPSCFKKDNAYYIIPSDWRGDSSGEDFYVKLPEQELNIPIQITQSGIQIFRKFHNPDKAALLAHIKKAESRIRKKRWLCRRNGVVFVLVQDFLGQKTNRNLAWCDRKALLYAIRSMKPP